MYVQYMYIQLYIFLKERTSTHYLNLNIDLMEKTKQRRTKNDHSPRKLSQCGTFFLNINLFTCMLVICKYTLACQSPFWKMNFFFFFGKLNVKLKAR